MPHVKESIVLMDDNEALNASDMLLSEEDKQLIEELEALLEEEKQERQRMLDGLAAYVSKEFSERRSLRTTIESRWLTAESLYLGSLGANVIDSKNPFYNDEHRNEIHPQFNLIRTKVDNTVAVLISSQFATGDKNWSIKPSPSAELCPEDEQLAAQRAQQKSPDVTPEMVQSERQKLSLEKARGMSSTIEDQLEISNYGKNCRESIFDLVRIGSSVMKGPTNSAKMKKSYNLQYTQDGKRVYIPSLSSEPRPGVYRVDPWLFFPKMTTADPCNIPDSIEVHPFVARELQDLKSNPGFFADVIDEILKEKPKSWEAPTSTYGPAGLTSGTERLFKDKYLLLEYHGPISRKKLDMMDVSYSCDNEDEDTVFGEIWVCNDKVIRFDVHSLEGQNEIPYAIDNFKKDPGSVFGFGLPDILQDQQVVSNQLYRYALWNVGLTAMPIGVINKAIISSAATGQGLDVVPGKLYVANEHDSDIDLSKALRFIDVPTQQEELVNFMQFVRGLAEEESNMPAVMAGLQTPQGEESATGIAVRGENATAPLFFQSQQWDDNITKKVIGWMYDWNMQFNPDDFIKGDYEIDVTSQTQRIKQQKMRLDVQNVLQMAGQNPEVSLNVDSNAMLRNLLQMMELPEGGIRTPEEVEAESQRRAQNQQPDPNMLKAQADMLNAQNKSKELDLEAQRLQLEQQELQHRAQMEYATKMENYETREKEAGIRLAEKQMDLQIEYLKLAQKDDQNRAQYVFQAQQLQAKMAMEQTKLGVDAQLKATDQALYQQEMKIKEKQGSGV